MTPGLILMRECTLAFRRASGVYATLAFCALAFATFAFSLGPDALAADLAPVLAVAVLFSCLLSLPALFAYDAEDGTLELYLLTPLAPEWLVATKLFAFWLTHALPLVLLTPLLALMGGIAPDAIAAITTRLLFATPTLVAIGGVGTALTLGLRRSGFTQTLILLPLYLPPLIFASAPASAPVNLILAAMALAAVPLACFACGWLLKRAGE